MMKNTLPLITIGITCFNAANTILRGIESAKAQDWPDIEILIVDDCSDDGSLEIIGAAQKKDERIRLIRHAQNKGYPSALNTIIEEAKGDYIAFFDDDDDHEPDRLSKQYDRLTSFEKEHTDKPVLCYAHRRVFVDGIEKQNAFVHAIGATAPEPHGEMVADFVLWHKQEPGYTWGEFGSCTLMAAKETIERFKFDPAFRRSAEWDLAVRMALDGAYFIAVDEPLIIQHKTETDDKAGTKPLEYGLKLRKKHKAFLKKKGTYWGALCLAYARFYYFRNKRWKSRFCLALACLASPFKILPDVLEKRA